VVYIRFTSADKASKSFSVLSFKAKGTSTTHHKKEARKQCTLQVKWRCTAAGREVQVAWGGIQE